MLDFGGKTLLERQLYAYRRNEIKDLLDKKIAEFYVNVESTESKPPVPW